MINIRKILHDLSKKYPFKMIMIGSKVQWISGGVEQWDQPRKIISFDTYEGKTYAFCEGSKTGIPTEELKIYE